MTNIIETPDDEVEATVVVTWDTVREQRNAMLLAAERRYNFDTPEPIKAAWRAYKQELRDLPEKYADLEDLSQIEWPQLPTVQIQQLSINKF